MTTTTQGNGIEQGARDTGADTTGPGASRHARSPGSRQSADRAEDDGSAVTDGRGMQDAGGRGTPRMGDVRSDANAGAGPGNGEPL